MPTLRALECFVATVETGSITGAAAKLHLSQPALSHQIAMLENELGSPLLERLPRGVRPTSAGREALPSARAALDAADRVVQAGRAALDEGELRIGCAGSMTAGLLAPLLRNWRRRHRKIRLVLQERSSADELAAMVTNDEIDVAICPRPTRWDGALELLASEEVVIVFATDDPLGDQPGPVPISALHGYPVIQYAGPHGLAGWLDGLFREHQVSPEVVIRTRQTTTAPALAAAGLGAAVVPVSGIPAGFTGSVHRLDPPQARDVVALMAGRSDVLVQQFVGSLRETGLRIPAAVLRQLEARTDGARSGR
ncbi:LysR family transcriptional regulator [Kribbella albertanoniae]|uniref:LysR family transcriptional regulator n=1 Tax=Kribbella albertanoniae TaxID=1266829 RepID=A0A4V2XS42_9ACTN|nr:LysR family transcriptional regulator [Kribbella albertanoniae]TDC32395.1 LysR family transcriptional regulator [Kribbella albertanoniae]